MTTNSMTAPQSTGQIVGGAFKAYWRHYPTFLTIRVALQVPLFLAAIWFWTVITGWAGRFPYLGMGSGLVGILASFLGGLLAFVFLSALDMALVNTAVAHATTESREGRSPIALQSLIASLGRVGPLFGAIAALTLAWVGFAGAMLGLVWATGGEGLVVFLICLPFVLYLAVRWCFVSQAVILDGAGPWAASLSRSSQMVAGSWWRVFGIGLLLWIIQIAIQNVLTGAMMIVIASPGFAEVTGSIFGFQMLQWLPIAANSVISVLGGALQPIAMTLLYLDQRNRTSQPAPVPAKPAPLPVVEGFWS